MTRWRSFWSDTRGVTFIQYGLMTLLVAVVIVTGIRTVGANFNQNAYGKAASSMPG